MELNLAEKTSMMRRNSTTSAEKKLYGENKQTNLGAREISEAKPPRRQWRNSSRHKLHRERERESNIEMDRKLDQSSGCLECY